MTGLQFSTDGSMALSRSESSVYFWRLERSGRLRPQCLPLPQTTNLRFSPDGKFFAAMGQSNWLWSAEYPMPTPVPFSLASGLKVKDLAFSPDSSRVIAVYEDGSAILYETLTGTPLRQALPFVRTICVAFSDDGHMLATANADGEARVWDAATGEPLTPLLPVRGKVDSLRFSADGKRLMAQAKAARDSNTFTDVWALPTCTLSTDRLFAVSALLSGQPSPAGVAAAGTPEATRQGWKTWLDRR